MLKEIEAYTKEEREWQVCESIKDVAKAEGVDPIDVDFNTWRSGVDDELKATYRSLGVEFSLIKKANFKAKPNTAKFDIKARAKAKEVALVKEEKQTLFMDKFSAIANKLWNKPLVVKPYKTKKSAVIKRVDQLVLSDLHFGADLDGIRTFIKYGRVEEARSFASLMTQTADYKTQYRDNSHLAIHLLGDIIQGKLHDPLDGDRLAEQINRAVYVISQGIVFLASQFPSITVFHVPGNHDRHSSDKDRKVTDKDDGLANVIYFSIKQIIERSVKNVKMDYMHVPAYTYKPFDQTGMFTHGDTVFEGIGFPGTSIDIKKARNKMNEYNARQGPDDQIKLFVVGHVHVGSMVRLPSGIFLSNGAAIPSDQYAISKDIPETARGQWLFETVPGHIVGDSRFLELNEKIHQDASLDAIVKPYDF